MIELWHRRNDGHVLILNFWCSSKKQDGFVVYPTFKIVNF